MAFGVEELRVLRRALALALHPTSASPDDVQDCLRLAESLDEATREGARLRAFLVADLGRYRAALPGTAAGYLTLLDEALGAGYRPHPHDLSALRALRGNPTAAALLDRCRLLAEQRVRTHAQQHSRTARPATRMPPAAPTTPTTPTTPTVPAARTRLLALPGGLSTPADSAKDTPGRQPEKKPARKPPAPKPAPKPTPAPTPAPAPGTPKPSRPIPTPGEVFPRRKPTPPPPANPQQLAAG
ncbi:hypothetical protein [Streptomyces violaceus]|uniref:Uncharacterized protein n=1 Tax=Streptomyces violaceus TaxID=1936 RepID=A0ABY9ULR8_STRVL|nr:hypothetical protein [Streptomyces janthinus]WND23808.1 hypothetical protein RI060_18040 [Streptomyces janthinus]GGT00913.1 hypothetical protein GCM10010270_85830 [Streptomyces janthinus]